MAADHSIKWYKVPSDSNIMLCCAPWCLLNTARESIRFVLPNGEKFEGFKVVEGRSNRKWNDTAEEKLEEELADKAWTHKLIGIGEAEKLLKKEIVNELTYKSPGKLTLVPESDKRKAFDDVKDQFEKLEKE